MNSRRDIMNRNKPYFLRRVIAYLIDMIIVMLLSSIISMIIFNRNDNQKQAEQLLQLTGLTSKYEGEKITKEEYNSELDKLIEQLTKDGLEEPIESFVAITKQYAMDEVSKEEYEENLSKTVNNIEESGTGFSTAKMYMLMNDYTSGSISSEEFNKEYNILNYYVTKDNLPTLTTYCIMALIYYVIMCYFCHGITLGKYIMRIRITSANDKELNMGNYLLRSIFINLILSYLASIILVTLLDINSFSNVSSKVSTVLTLLIIASMITMMYREDGRGLHDLIANTIVVSIKKNKESIETDEVKEAIVVKEEKRKPANKKSKK